MKRSTVYHKNFNGKQKISFTAKHEEKEYIMMDQDYIQICDRKILTAKRSLEKEEKERSNLLNWAVFQIIGEEPTIKIKEEEEEEEEVFLSLQNYSDMEFGNHISLSACVERVVACRVFFSP